MQPGINEVGNVVDLNLHSNYIFKKAVKSTAKSAESVTESVTEKRPAPAIAPGAGRNEQLFGFRMSNMCREFSLHRY